MNTPNSSSPTIGRPVSAQKRFARLEALEQQSAHTLARYCQVHSGAHKFGNHAKLSLASLVQSLVTSLPLVVTDTVVMWFVLLTATGIAERLLGLPTTTIQSQTAFISAVLMFPLARLAGMYPGFGMNPVVEFRNILRCSGMALLIFVAVGMTMLLKSWTFFLTASAIAYLLSIVVFPSARFVVRTFMAAVPFWGAPVLIYGTPQIATDLYRRLKQMPDRGFRPVGVLLSPEDYWSHEQNNCAPDIPYSDVRSCFDVANKQKATWVLISHEVPIEQEELEPGLLAIPNRVHLASSSFDMGPWDQIYTVGPTCGLWVGGVVPKSLKVAAKRFIDIAMTICGGLVLSPLLAFISIAIKLSSKGPILYGQKRVGLGGETFTAWKFRSMVPNADKVLDEYLQNNDAAREEWEQTHKLKNDPRVTWIGKFIRTTSFDEFPQLWNVFVGEMSIVGPRPIVNSPTYDQSYIVDYPHEFSAYKTVRPGITGMWQVSCRNAGVYEKRIYWDMYYIRHWSLWLDMYIILRTIRTVLLREGSA